MKTVTSGHSWTTITVTMEDGNEVEINLHHDKSIGAALPLFMGQKE
jgi:DNA polymerase/3'-5' exonuclease PolX